MKANLFIVFEVDGGAGDDFKKLLVRAINICSADHHEREIEIFIEGEERHVASSF